MALLFTSDLHLCHKRICEFTKRGKSTSQEEHDEWLIKLWNEVVKPGDIVYHVGDFSMQWDLEVVSNLLYRLNGQKIMIVGNHDDENLLHHIKATNSKARLLNVRDMAYVKVCGMWTHICHYPMGSWRNMSHGSWHIHGHSHGHYRNGGEGRILDVGIDSAYKLYGKHALFTEDMVNEHMQARAVTVNDSHRKPHGGKREPSGSDGAPIPKT